MHAQASSCSGSWLETAQDGYTVVYGVARHGPDPPKHDKRIPAAPVTLPRLLLVDPNNPLTISTSQNWLTHVTRAYITVYMY